MWEGLAARLEGRARRAGAAPARARGRALRGRPGHGLDLDVRRRRAQPGGVPRVLRGGAREPCAAGVEVPFATLDAGNGRADRQHSLPHAAPRAPRSRDRLDVARRGRAGRAARTSRRSCSSSSTRSSGRGCMRVEFKTDAKNERSRRALAALPAAVRGRLPQAHARRRRPRPAARLGVLRDRRRRLAGGEGEPAAEARPVKEIGEGVFQLESTGRTVQHLPRPGRGAGPRRHRDGTAGAPRSWTSCARTGRSPSSSLLTHADFDHSRRGRGGHDARPGAPICAPAAEQPLLTGRAAPPPRSSASLIRSVNRGRAPRLPSIDRWLEPGEVVAGLEAIADTGPHARPHGVPARHDAVAGDAVITGDDASASRWRVFCVDRAEARRSIEKLAALDVDLARQRPRPPSRGREGEAGRAGRDLAARRSDVEADVQDVALADDVVLPLEPLEAALAHLRARGALDQVAPTRSPRSG